MCNSFQHLKIFLSVRSEAYVNNQDSTRLQLDDYSTFLSYSKEDVRKIFLMNINGTDENLLCKSNTTLGKLTGHAKIQHRFIENNQGVKQNEDIFSFIYRHTFGRPREIVEMGNSIINRYNPEERSQQNINKVVNEIAYKLFDQLKNEIIPYFEDTIFMHFCKRLKKNVLTFEQASFLSKEIKKEHNFADVFSYMYRLG